MQEQYRVVWDEQQGAECVFRLYRMEGGPDTVEVKDVQIFPQNEYALKRCPIDWSPNLGGCTLNFATGDATLCSVQFPCDGVFEICVNAKDGRVISFTHVAVEKTETGYLLRTPTPMPASSIFIPK